MITNEHQYRMTKAAARRFEQALATEDGPGTEQIAPRIKQAIREGLQSHLDDLREELAAYEALRAGQVGVVSVASLDELPQALIQARIAAGLTQKQLAERLNLKEQQVQQYEATQYTGASFRRVQEVAAALEIQLASPLHLQVGARPAETSTAH